MKILITGGTGLIGRFLIPRLQELDHSITVVTRDPAKAQQTLGDKVALLPGLDDLTDLNDFDAVINPPEGLILAVGAGEKRPYVVNDALAIATVMSATGSFDHRAIDGAVGAEFMAAFKRLVESPMGMLA